jgi:hypothetical protein
VSATPPLLSSTSIIALVWSLTTAFCGRGFSSRSRPRAGFLTSFFSVLRFAAVLHAALTLALPRFEVFSRVATPPLL